MSYYNNKTVLLVGGGDYDIGEEKYHDVVVKTNLHWLNQGGRLDALYINGGVEVVPTELLRKAADLDQEPKVIATYTHAKYYKQLAAWCNRDDSDTWLVAMDVNSQDPYLYWLHQVRHLFFWYIGAGTPTIGAVAAWHIISQPVKSLHIVGMDLHSNDMRQGPRSHDMDAHAQFFDFLIRMDRRVSLDYRLANAVHARLNPGAQPDSRREDEGD